MWSLLCPSVVFLAGPWRRGGWKGGGWGSLSPPPRRVQRGDGGDEGDGENEPHRSLNPTPIHPPKWNWQARHSNCSQHYFLWQEILLSTNRGFNKLQEMRLQLVVKRLLLSSAMEVAVSTHDLSLSLSWPFSRNPPLPRCVWCFFSFPYLTIQIEQLCCLLKWVHCISRCDPCFFGLSPSIPSLTARLFSCCQRLCWYSSDGSHRFGLELWKSSSVCSVFGFQRGQSGCAETRAVALLDMVVSILGTSRRK